MQNILAHPNKRYAIVYALSSSGIEWSRIYWQKENGNDSFIDDCIFGPWLKYGGNSKIMIID